MAYRPWEELERKKKIDEYFSGLNSTNSAPLAEPAPDFNMLTQSLMGNIGPLGSYAPGDNSSEGYEGAGQGVYSGYQGTNADIMSMGNSLSNISSGLNWATTGMTGLGMVAPTLMAGLPSGLGQAMTLGQIGTGLLGKAFSSYGVNQYNQDYSKASKAGFPGIDDDYNYNSQANLSLDFPNGPPSTDPTASTIGNFANDPAMWGGGFGASGLGLKNTVDTMYGAMPSSSYYDGYGSPAGTYSGTQGGYVGADIYGNPTGGADGAGAGGNGGTVICTELHRQGYISDDFYRAEAKYGYSLPTEIMEGYRSWAMPIVGWMKKSKVITQLVRVISKPILNEMAHRANKVYEPSLIGSVVLSIALPVCFLIGSLKNVSEGACNA
jgi:hypothetical protein